LCPQQRDHHNDSEKCRCGQCQPHRKCRRTPHLIERVGPGPVHARRPLAQQRRTRPLRACESKEIGKTKSCVAWFGNPPDVMQPRCGNQTATPAWPTTYFREPDLLTADKAKLASSMAHNVKKARAGFPWPRARTPR